MVRAYLSPVGWARLFPKRSNNFLVFGAPASIMGSELQGLTGSGLYTVLGRAVSFITPIAFGAALRSSYQDDQGRGILRSVSPL